jgi:AraC-like DNA-binding protein
MSDNRYSKDLMIQTLTVELMINLSRAMRNEWEENIRVKTGKAKELVAIARQYMDDNFDQGITVAQAAQYVFLSQGYFTRAFVHEMGISPMNYLMKKRIERACSLLENNEIKVSAISLQSGFSSPQRFNVAFRKLMGMTPMEYRKLHLK